MNERGRDARQSVEYSAKTVDDALQRAARDLGLPVGDLNYKIVEDSSHSFLGLVRTGRAIIRVSPPMPREKEAPPPTEAVEKKEPLKRPEPQPVPPNLRRNPPELEEEASKVASTLLDKMGLLTAVEVADRGGEVDQATDEVSPLRLNIIGDDLGILIGRRGETLRDLQFLVRLILSRKLGVWPNLVLDVEGYKAKRATVLRSLASRMADHVRQSGSLVTLEPMPAYERRIIHLTLRDDPDVYTESTGDGDARKVQILPK